MGSRACTQVRLWHARDAAQQAGEGAEAPSKGLSWTCWVWPLDSVDFSSASSSEFGSGSSAAAGISDAVVAEWPRAAGCGRGSYAWVSAAARGDSAATPLSAGSAKETRLVLRDAIFGLYTYQKNLGGETQCGFCRIKIK